MQLGRACQKPKSLGLHVGILQVEKVEKNTSGSAEHKGTRVKTLDVVHVSVKGGMKFGTKIPRPPKGS